LCRRENHPQRINLSLISAGTVETALGLFSFVHSNHRHGFPLERTGAAILCCQSHVFVLEEPCACGARRCAACHVQADEGHGSVGLLAAGVERRGPQETVRLKHSSMHALCLRYGPDIASGKQDLGLDALIMNSIGRDSDVAKWVEAACYMLIQSPDPELAHLVEEAVDMIRGAQREDGYISTPTTRSVVT
jgi:hypothetical protein